MTAERPPAGRFSAAEYLHGWHNDLIRRTESYLAMVGGYDDRMRHVRDMAALDFVDVDDDPELRAEFERVAETRRQVEAHIGHWLRAEWILFRDVVALYSEHHVGPDDTEGEG